MKKILLSIAGIMFSLISGIGIGKATITDIAFDPSGNFGNNLFYSTSERNGTGSIYMFQSDGSIQRFYSHHEKINTITFSNNSSYGSNLYIGSRNGGTSGSQIYRIDSGVNSSLFATSNSGELLTDITFDTSGNFSNSLYSSTVVNYPGGFTKKIDYSGNVSNFSTFSPTILTGVAFGTKNFGNTNLFVANEANSSGGDIYTVNSMGQNSIFTSIPDLPVNLSFSNGGSFGDNLYVSTYRNGNIYRVNTLGAFNLFASGFQFGSGFTGDIEFDPTGNSLFVADNNYIYQLNGSGEATLLIEHTPVPIPGAVWLLGSGIVGLGVTRIRRKRKK